MEKRRFGRTGHMSSIAIFGGAAFGGVTQENADIVMEMVINAGINHIDIAPSYGQAELRTGPWMPRYRDHFFLGCKTTERTNNGAWVELNQSLKRLQTRQFDLYQIHAVTTMEELDLVTRKGGSLEACIKAKEEGLTNFIGITGHGINSPSIFLEALKRYDFDSVLFPLNFVQMSNLEYRKNAETLISECTKKDAGTMVIKSITKGPWNDQFHTADTWYEPFSEKQSIQDAINFSLSFDVTGICTVGDIKILPSVLEACSNFRQLNKEEIEKQINFGKNFVPLFT